MNKGRQEKMTDSRKLLRLELTDINKAGYCQHAST